MTQRSASQRTHPLTAQLVAAIRATDALHSLSFDELDELLQAVGLFTGDLDGFREELAAEWEIARPPTDTELADADVWDCGLIDWLGDEDVEDLAELEDETDGWVTADRLRQRSQLEEAARLDFEVPVDAPSGASDVSAPTNLGDSEVAA